MPPKRLRVLLSFTREPDESVVQTTRDAIAGLKDNNYFPHPPADPATLEAKLGEFIEAITAANQGGPHDRLFKQKKRDELVMLLRQDALYVQGACHDDLEKLMSSGFLPASTNRTSSPLSTPVITSLGQGNRGQLVVGVKKIPNARTHDVRFAPVGTVGAPATDWMVIQGFTNSRSMALNGLVPGTTYTVQVRAIGASGLSEWSNAASCICW